jgi:large subunit ribosomal protein L25
MEKLLFKTRDIIGKKSKNLISEGYIPSVVYNSKRDSRNTKIDSSTASKIVREATSTTIFDAELDGKDIKVVVKEVDANPLTDQIRHIAFFEIDEAKEMVFTIPFEITGTSPAVKNNLGVLVEVLASIDVKCKLSSLIPVIEVDISKLEHPGQSISVNEIDIPKGISLINEELENATIVTITEMQEEEIFEVETPEEGEEVEGETGEEVNPEDAVEAGEKEE